nr:hypothetical protein [Propionicimonas sp.]
MSILGKSLLAGVLAGLTLIAVLPAPAGSAATITLTTEPNICEYAPWWPGCW